MSFAALLIISLAHASASSATHAHPDDLRPIAGRVVGRDGEPVAGATVFQSGDSPKLTEAATDTDGRFRLSGVAAVPTFLFAKKPGYRFAGIAIDAAAQDVT